LDFVETHGKVSVRQGVSADSQLANHERFGLAYWLRVGPALFAKFCFPF
jgi:hypothetical protein